LKIEYLWKSLRSVIFLIGLFKIDPPQVDLKYSIFNHLKIGIIAQLKFFAIKSTKIITKILITAEGTHP